MTGSFANFNSSQFNNLRQSQHNVANPEQKPSPAQPPKSIPVPPTTSTEPPKMKQNILNPVSQTLMNMHGFQILRKQNPVEISQ